MKISLSAMIGGKVGGHFFQSECFSFIIRVLGSELIDYSSLKYNFYYSAHAVLPTIADLLLFVMITEYLQDPRTCAGSQDINVLHVIISSSSFTALLFWKR